MPTAPARPTETAWPGAAAVQVVGAVALASTIAWALDPQVSLTVLAMVYLVAVVAVAYRSSRRASAATAVLAVLALNFLFVPPRGTLSVDGREHLLTLAALLAVALLVSDLSARLREAAALAQQREARARALQRLAGELAALDDEPAMLRAGLAALRDAGGPATTLVLLDRAAGLRSADPAADAPAAGTLPHQALTHCASSGEALGPGTARWSELDQHYLPLGGGAHGLGAVAVPAAGLDAGAVEQLRAIADLLAGALLRARQAAQAAAADAEARAQKLRNALLAAVSHDFRTPLAAIVGAVSALQRQHDRLPDSDRERLLALVDDEARQLAAMTDNTLQWARLSGAAPALNADWESVEELVGSVLARVRQRDPGRRIRADVPADLPLLRADALLLAQLLDNLLDNALKYSDGPVELRARAAGAQLTIDVLDRGPGLADDELPRLFDTFFRGRQARGRRGAGLGLAVGQAIAQAHGGSLSAARRRSGGSRFRLSLPLPTAPDAPEHAGPAA